MEDGATSSKTEGFLSRMALNDNKAGMEGLDRDKINKIIMEASKGSRFYENELKREQQVNQRIEKMMLQKAQITEQQLRTAQVQVDKMASAMERGRDLSRVIVHVDMDAFYAAVEMRDCPELKDKPMAVGSMSMLTTSNYHARKYGVRAAMPGFIAKKLCPHLVIVPANFDKYRAVSDEIREIFAEYDPHFQPMSLDEAYLDFTDHLEQRQSWPESSRTHRLRTTGDKTGQPEPPPEAAPEEKDLSPLLFEDSPTSSPCFPAGFQVFGASVEEAVREMRFRIEQKTTLTASAGIAPNMMLAKVCSDKNKPNGQYRLPSTRAAVMDFIQNLPVRKVSGIGKVSEKMLKALGVSSCADLGQQMALLSLMFSETSWHHFLQVSMGLGSTYIPRHEERKSMSTERTFKELSKAEEQLSFCRELCEDLAADMKTENLRGKTVTLKLKNVNFETKSRALTLPYAVSTADDIFAVAKDLLRTEIEHESPQPLRLRLMGVRISAFVGSDDKKPQQRSIVRFLQPGKTDCGRSAEVKQHKCDRGDVPSQSAQSRTPACPPPTRKQEEVSWQSKKRGLEGGQAGETPQLSFFQRAQAKRLQQQAAQPSTPAESRGENGSLTPPTEPDAPNNAESLTKASESNGPDFTERETEAKASTSGCGASQSSSLTCPVCFMRTRVADLNAFNTHIDRCLRESSAKTDQSSGPDSDSDGCDEEREETSERKEPEAKMTHRGKLPPKSDGSPQNVVSVGGNKTTTVQQPHGGESPALICPVCQLTQDTDDLMVFNRHVDLCLNQEVLNELGGPTSGAMNAPPGTNGKTSDKVHLLPRQASKGKSKRQTTPSSPPAKRARNSACVNTIDKFFR